jgi:hypothetical protein
LLNSRAKAVTEVTIVRAESVIVSLALAILAGGCATWEDMDPPQRGTAVGATGGAVVGGIVGGPVGAAAGGGVGGYAGHHEGRR